MNSIRFSSIYTIRGQIRDHGEKPRPKPTGKVGIVLKHIQATLADMNVPFVIYPQAVHAPKSLKNKPLYQDIWCVMTGEEDVNWFRANHDDFLRELVTFHQASTVQDAKIQKLVKKLDTDEISTLTDIQRLRLETVFSQKPAHYGPIFEKLEPLLKRAWSATTAICTMKRDKFNFITGEVSGRRNRRFDPESIEVSELSARRPFHMTLSGKQPNAGSLQVNIIEHPLTI